jgi:hypothetical protein
LVSVTTHMILFADAIIIKYFDQKRAGEL